MSIEGSSQQAPGRIEGLFSEVGQGLDDKSIPKGTEVLMDWKNPLV